MEDMLNAYEKRISYHLSMFLWLNKMRFYTHFTQTKCQDLSQTNVYLLEWLPNIFIWYKYFFLIGHMSLIVFNMVL